MSKQTYPILAPLLVSLFIYLFYRTERTVVNALVIRAVSFDTYASLRKAVQGFLPLNGLVVYSLPEGLWVFCITLTSRPYYIQLGNLRINGVGVPLMLCVGLELAQLLHLANGRFDPMDILVSLTFWCMAAFSYNDEPVKKNMLLPIDRSKLVCWLTYGIVYLSHVLP